MGATPQPQIVMTPGDTTTCDTWPRSRTWIYQVDTGPIAFPDLINRHEKPVDCLSLAFIVFNASHFADFVIEQLTPVNKDVEASPQTYHYSNPFSLPAKNRRLAVALPE